MWPLDNSAAVMLVIFLLSAGIVSICTPLVLFKDFGLSLSK